MNAVPIHHPHHLELLHQGNSGAFSVLGLVNGSLLTSAGISPVIQQVESNHIPPWSARSVTLTMSLKCVKLILPFSTFSYMYCGICNIALYCLSLSELRCCCEHIVECSTLLRVSAYGPYPATRIPIYDILLQSTCLHFYTYREMTIVVY